jgi:predicted RNase H-like HicB family nuclease
MSNIVKAEIYYDGEYYCAKCLDFDIFTQGKSLDEVVANLKEAIQLHFEDEEVAHNQKHIPTSLFTMMDLGEIRV